MGVDHPVAGVFGAIWMRARRMQAHESDADLRAIELCGDPEALIRGLTRIYQINHIPRRWSAQLEGNEPRIPVSPAAFAPFAVASPPTVLSWILSDVSSSPRPSPAAVR